ncbi:MAG: DUF2937 family protein [Pseudomonadota bacterium]
MITRVLIVAGGLLGGAGASQFPEFSQQYVQRLGGAVDALGQVVADFDASALAAGLSREQALAQLQGTAFLDRRRADMQRTVDRHAQLSADLQVMQRSGPFMRAYHAARSTDPEVARAALAAYEPALPLNMAGAIFAGVGFVAGWLAVRLFLWPLRRMGRIRRNA